MAKRSAPDKAKLQTLRDLIDSIGRYGNRPVVLRMRKKTVERTTYAELARQTEQLACGLVKAGIERGDHVILFADNGPEWITACLASIKAGAVVVPVDVQFGDKPLTHVLDDSEAKLVFTNASGVERIKKLDIKTPPQFVVLDGDEEDKRHWKKLPASVATSASEWTAGPNDVAVLFYTSGTTGRPKGVPLTHANLIFQINSLLATDLVKPTDRLLLPLPLHHVYPFVIGMLAPLAFGAPIVMPRSLTGPEIIRALREGEATMVLGVPRLYGALYSGITGRVESKGAIAAALFRLMLSTSIFLRRRLGLRAGKVLLHSLHKQIGPSLRVMASGGAAINPELAWKLESLGWQVAIGYGLTETSPLLTLKPPGEGDLASVGQPIPGVELRIDPVAKAEESEERKPATESPRARGEVLARGPNVFQGYRHLPEETKKAFTEGWFRTGDLGYLDKDGALHLLGRASTLIVTEGGKNIQPEDVEEVYQEHPVIREIGILQRDGKLVGVVVPKLSAIGGNGEDAIQKAVHDAVNAQSKRLPSYQRISDFAVTRDPLPRTRLGKIRRHVLEQTYEKAKAGKKRAGLGDVGAMSIEEMSSEDRTLLDNSAARQVWDWLAERHPDKRLTPESSPQLDLGVDSMEWLNLTLEIGQRTGIELSEEAIGRIDTVRDLLQEVANAAEEGEGRARVKPLEDPEETISADQKRWLEPLNPVQSVIARILFVINRILMVVLFRRRVCGLEHLPEEGPFILAPNHVSYLDSLAVASAFTFRRMRQTHWAGWTEAAFANPVLRAISRLAQAVPIDPKRAIVSSLAFGAAALKRKKNLVWFPEGGRSPDGRLQPFRPGIGLLLNHFNVAVVPVYIDGTFEAMPVGRSVPRLKPITVTFGEPLDPRKLKKEGKGEEAHQRIAHALREHVEKLAAKS